MTAENNAWNQMFKTSQKMMDNWMDAFLNSGNSSDNDQQSGSAGFSFNDYYNWMKFQEPWVKAWQDMMNLYGSQQDWFAGPGETWKKLMESYRPFSASDFMNVSSQNVFEKMLNSNKFYMDMYEQWDKFNEDILQPGTKDYMDHVKQLVDKFNKLFLEQFVPLMPKDLQGLLNSTQSYFNSYQKTLENFLGPWASAYRNISDVFMVTMLKDPTELPEALEQWKHAYDQTFGVIMKSPVVGNMREMLEQNNRTINAMIEMLVTLSEFTTSSLTVAYQHSEEAIKQYLDSLEKGEEPKTFQEFYDIWSENVEKAIENYFYTDEFSKLIAKTTDSYMTFKIESDKLIEKALEDLPVVTKSEVDNVYKNVIDLRREVRSLKKEMENLKKNSETPAKK